MKLKIAVAVVVLGVGAAVYFLFLRGSDGPGNSTPADRLAYEKRECGNGDPANGGQPAACVGYALDLMGREDVPPDDDAARSVLKRSCDHAYQAACDILAEFPSHRANIAEGRCDGSWYPAVASACIDAGKAYEDGAGRRQSWMDAKKWYDKACKLGLREGCDHAERMVSK